MTMINDRAITASLFQSSMLGAAIGDAVAGRVQNSPLQAGATTHLALFAAEGLLRAFHRAKLRGTNGTFAELVYESYQRWLQTKTGVCVSSKGISHTDGWLLRRPELYQNTYSLHEMLESLSENQMGDIEHPVNHKDDFEGMVALYPVGLIFAGDAKSAFKLGAEICALTHGSRDAILSSGYYATLISLLAAGQSLTQAISNALDQLAEWSGSEKVKGGIVSALYLYDETEQDDPERLDVSIGDFINRLDGSTKAFDILCFGLYCALRFSGDFAEAIKQAVRYKAAPFATASIAGSIIGLIAGSSAIPSAWIQGLTNRDLVMQVAEDLQTGIKGSLFAVNRDWADKYPGY